MCYDRDTKKMIFFLKNTYSSHHHHQHLACQCSTLQYVQSLLVYWIFGSISIVTTMWLVHDKRTFKHSNIEYMKIFYIERKLVYCHLNILYKTTNVKPINFIGKMIGLSSKNRRCIYELLLHDNISSNDNPLGNWLI